MNVSNRLIFNVGFTVHESDDYQRAFTHLYFNDFYSDLSGLAKLVCTSENFTTWHTECLERKSKNYGVYQIEHIMAYVLAFNRFVPEEIVELMDSAFEEHVNEFDDLNQKLLACLAQTSLDYQKRMCVFLN